MSKARDLANLVATQLIKSDTSGIPALPVVNFVYGADDVPLSLPEGHIYIKVETGV